MAAAVLCFERLCTAPSEEALPHWVQCKGGTAGTVGLPLSYWGGSGWLIRIWLPNGSRSSMSMPYGR
jgi:hypothetical protein